MYDQIYLQYPAPSPPAPAAGPSLLNDQEYGALSGFLETISDEPSILFGGAKIAGLEFWDDEPQFPQLPLSPHHLQPYMGNPLAAASSTLNRIVNNSNTSLHTTPLQNNSIPSTPTQPQGAQQVIVNPFSGHGLAPHPNPVRISGEDSALNSLAWGSDPSFRTSGFHPSLQPASEQDIQRKVYAIINIQDSTVNTAANSPAEVQYERIGEEIPLGEVGNNFTTGNPHSPTLSATQSSGFKRRADDGAEDQQGQVRKSRPRKDSTDPAPKGKRGGKREQLTEAEKRANHIHSEQKRRNQIKNGFDTLTEMVPDLKGGGYSKSAVLQHVAVYVTKLTGGNATLREILKRLEEQHNSSSGPPSASCPTRLS